MIMKKRLAGLGFLLAGLVFAQSSTPLAFEVASIKPSAPHARGMSLQMTAAGIRTTNTPVRMLITFAYDIRDFQLAGGPAWVGTERFDVIAKSERTADDASPSADIRKMTDSQRTRFTAEMRERVKALLAERFQLAIHRENREGSIYALAVAKGGSKLELAGESPEGPQGIRMGRGQLTGAVAPLAILANVLSSQLGHPVVDKTGLAGKYNFKLEWSPSPEENGAPGDPSKMTDTVISADPSGPSIFTALQEQLGLKLESQKGPIETIVIDRVEKPTQN